MLSLFLTLKRLDFLAENIKILNENVCHGDNFLCRSQFIIELLSCNVNINCAKFHSVCLFFDNTY